MFLSSLSWATCLRSFNKLHHIQCNYGIWKYQETYTTLNVSQRNVPVETNLSSPATQNTLFELLILSCDSGLLLTVTNASPLAQSWRRPLELQTMYLRLNCRRKHHHMCWGQTIRLAWNWNVVPNSWAGILFERMELLSIELIGPHSLQFHVKLKSCYRIPWKSVLGHWKRPESCQFPTG